MRVTYLQGMVAVAAYRVGDTLIDTGCPHTGEALAEVLRDDPPSRVICTHQHEDHVGGIAALRRAFGDIEAFLPREHVPVVANPAPLATYRSESWGALEACGELTPFDPGDVFEDGGVALQAVSTPGHTPGHTAFVAETGSKVFALTGDLYLLTKPKHAFFESSAPDRVASCRELAEFGDSLVIMPTHSRPREDGAMLLNKLADWMEHLTDRFEEAALEIGTRDPVAVAVHHFGGDAMRRITNKEASSTCLVQSVFSPVKFLPAPPPP